MQEGRCGDDPTRLGAIRAPAMCTRAPDEMTPILIILPGTVCKPGAECMTITLDWMMMGLACAWNVHIIGDCPADKGAITPMQSRRRAHDTPCTGMHTWYMSAPRSLGGCRARALNNRRRCSATVVTTHASDCAAG